MTAVSDNRLHVRRRPHPKRRIQRALSLGGAPAMAGGPAIDVTRTPQLGMSEPEDGRAAVISGGLVTLLHAAVLAVLFMISVVAPEVVEKVIPVEIRKDEPVELPGSNEAPAPAPKQIAARPSAAAMAAPQLDAAELEALRRAALEAARKALEDFDLSNPQAAKVGDLGRKRIESESMAAKAAAAVAPQQPVKPRRFDVDIDPAQLQALQADLSGPRQYDPSELAEIDGADAFAVLAEIGDARYEGSLEGVELPSGIGAGGFSVEGADTGAGGGFEGGSDSGVAGGVPGGTGTATGTVPCLKSAYVQRYLDDMEKRANSRWEVPPGLADAARVAKIRLKLDPAGVMHDEEIVASDDDALGQSALQALKDASPFPPMNDDNRCLATKRIVVTMERPEL